MDHSPLIPFAQKNIFFDLGIFSLELLITDQGYFELSKKNNKISPDLSLHASADTIFVFMLDDLDSVFSSIRVEGDAKLAASLSKLIKQVEVDKEAILAGIIGDIPAYHLHRITIHLATIAMNINQSIMHSYTNFLFEHESKLCPRILRKPLFKQFKSKVAETINEIAYLEKRINKLIFISE